VTPRIARLKGFARAFVIACLAALLLGRDAIAQPIATEEASVWFLRLLGEESALESAFHVPSALAAEERAWAVIEHGRIKYASARVRAEIERAGVEPDFSDVEPHASLLSKLRSVGVDTAFMTGEPPAGTAGRSIALVSRPNVTAADLADCDVIIAKDEAVHARVAAVVPDKPVFLQRSKMPLLNLTRTLPRSNLPELYTPIRSIRFFHNIPSTAAEVRAIHGTSGPAPSADSLRQWGQGARHLSDGDMARVVDLGTTRDETIAARLTKSLGEGPADELRVILAHVDHGALAFQDGSATLLGDLMNQGHVAVLGCASAAEASSVGSVGIGTLTDLSYPDALATAEELKVEVRRGTTSKPATTLSVLGKVSEGTERLLVGIAGVMFIIQGPSPAKKNP
jgi:hypothetical protein